jgi:hypothetical protein
MDCNDTGTEDPLPESLVRVREAGGVMSWSCRLSGEDSTQASTELVKDPHIDQNRRDFLPANPPTLHENP